MWCGYWISSITSIWTEFLISLIGKKLDVCRYIDRNKKQRQTELLYAFICFYWIGIFATDIKRSLIVSDRQKEWIEDVSLREIFFPFILIHCMFIEAWFQRGVKWHSFYTSKIHSRGGISELSHISASNKPLFRYLLFQFSLERFLLLQFGTKIFV